VRQIWETPDRLKCVKEDPKNEFLCAVFGVAMSAVSILLALCAIVSQNNSEVTVNSSTVILGRLSGDSVE
jgi:hypothetical protein